MKSDTKIDGFGEYLAQHGAEVLAPTNPYEVIRYRRDDFGTVVVYTNAAGTLRWPEMASKHFSLFKAGQPLDKHRRVGGEWRENLIVDLIERDGDCCCYCGQPLGNDISIEHFLSIGSGGNNSPANTALAHKACNHAADSLPVMEKILLRDRMLRTAKDEAA